jgi:hypothetical protein
MSEERRAVTPIRPAAAYIGGKRENVEGVELPRHCACSNGGRELSKFFHLRCQVGISTYPVSGVLTFQNPHRIVWL